MIPLIRAGAIMPLVHWMQGNARPVEERLREVDLGYAFKGDPNLPIPLGPGIEFLCAANRAEGPDFACRIVTSSSLQALGMIGAVALGANTVREALFHVAASLPLHTTHEIITVSPAPGGVLVREAWGLRMDDETRHVVQQYVAALIQALCANAGASLPVFGRVAIMPHPVHGLAHLRSCFGDAVEASTNRLLELFVPYHVANRPFPSRTIAQPSPDVTEGLMPLRGDGTLRTSAKIVMAAMLLDGTPTMKRLSHAAGLSARTFQRRLRAEDATFKSLLESVRRDLALAGLASGSQSASEVSRALGYSQQSSFTRAVRRWTDVAPRNILRGKKA